MSLTKHCLAIACLFVAAPTFAAGLSARDIQAQAWQKVEEANTNPSSDASSTAVIFQAEVDQYARELAAGKASSDVGHASVRIEDTKVPFVIDATQSQTGG